MDKIFENNSSDLPFQEDFPGKDDECDEEIDWKEVEREAIRDQEEEKRNKKMQNFSQGVFQPTNPWGQQQTTQYSPWGTNVSPTPTWGSNFNSNSNTTPQAPGFGSPQQTPSWQNFGWTSNQQQTQQLTINRQKKVIFCDLLDCLISSIDAAGKAGVHPRGIYDIYIRRDVIDKIRCFGASWIFILTNQNIQKGTEQEEIFLRMVDYVGACVASLCSLPLQNVQCIMKSSINPYDPCTKPSTGLIDIAMSRLEGFGLEKKDLVVIGSQSGFQGQSNRDAMMAANYGIDYVDVQQLITLYK